MKTQGEINAKIRNGTVLVMTAAKFKQHIRKGDTITPWEVDVVTTGTFSVMSGTYAVRSIPVAEKRRSKTADRVWLNGVPAVPGPCPNENLGRVDLIIYGQGAQPMKICELAKPFNDINNCIENEVSVKPQFNVAAPAFI